MKKLTLIEWMLLFVIVFLIGVLATSVAQAGFGRSEFLDLLWKSTAQRVYIIKE